MQTAVQQLIHDMRNIDMSIFNDEHCKKYLEMEKQQMKDVYMENVLRPFKFNFEQYYNETYGSKGSDEIEKSEKPINLTSSQTEISDEEIEKEANNLFAGDLMWSERIAFKVAIKWYREQLKKKQ